MVVFVVKRYAVREAKTWRYAVRKGGGGVTLTNSSFPTQKQTPHELIFSAGYTTLERTTD